MKISYLLFFVSVLFFGCLGNKQFLDSSYKNQDYKGKTLFIYPISQGQIQVANPDDFTDDFEGVENSAEFLASELSDKANTYFGEKFKKIEVIPGSQAEIAANAPTVKISEKLGDDPFEIRIPGKKAWAGMGNPPNFILVFEEVVYGRNVKTGNKNQFGQDNNLFNSDPTNVNTNPNDPNVHTTTKKFLEMGINYVIYDYSMEKPVGYGNVKGISNFTFAMTSDDWYKSANDAFKKIASKSPF